MSEHAQFQQSRTDLKACHIPGRNTVDQHPGDKPHASRSQSDSARRLRNERASHGENGKNIGRTAKRKCDRGSEWNKVDPMKDSAGIRKWAMNLLDLHASGPCGHAGWILYVGGKR